MRDFTRTALLDMAEAIRSRWFIAYSLTFGGLVAALFVFGVTESRVMGFTGLSRLMVTYIQLCMAILPIFVLITTVRSVAGDREAGVFEYLLSLPVPLWAWFWGKMAGRFVVVFAPVFLAMSLGALWGWYKGLYLPSDIYAYYTVLLIALAWTFLGLGMLISSVAHSSDVAQGMAFLVWLALILFMDLILLGLLTTGGMGPDLVVAVAIANPLQAFRTAAFLLFDPQLVILGPSAYIILDLFGRVGFLIWAVAYPIVLGSVAAACGYYFFRRGDLV